MSERNGKTWHVDTYEEMLAIQGAQQWDICIVMTETRSYIYMGGRWTLPPDPPEIVDSDVLTEEGV